MSPYQSRTRMRRPALVAATVAVTAALAAGPVRAAGPPDPDPSAPTASSAPSARPEPAGPPEPGKPPAPTEPTEPPEPTEPAEPPEPTAPEEPPGGAPAFGAYLDYGPRGVTRMTELSRWLDGAELRVGHTYLPGDRWSNIAGAPGFLEAWADWRTGGADRLFVLNVPMLERNEENVPDREVRRLLRAGAAGQYDRHFRALAERLVRLGVPDTVLVLGWEMNGTTYTHRCGPDPRAWKAYWNRIVTAMRAVPGQRFRFDFAPSRGRDAVPWTECYPGDDTVDIVGMDSYDQPRGMPFDEQVTEPYGLQAHVDFAREHGKPVSYPEWGLFRNGDNDEYMRRMLAWMDEHRPVYNTLTDYCPHGVWSCADNPRAARVYRSMLSGRTDGPGTPQPPPPTPTPTPTPAPAPVPSAASEPPARCTPLRLGAWFERWYGRELCLKLGPLPGGR